MIPSEVLADSSVIIDLTDPAAEHHVWSRETLRLIRRQSLLFYNQIVAAEVGVALTFLDQQRSPLLLRRDLPWAAAAPAGAAHVAYRERGGAREAVLSDYLIGAHGAVEGLGLLTRDPRRVRTAFPAVRLITPQSDPL